MVQCTLFLWLTCSISCISSLPIGKTPRFCRACIGYVIVFEVDCSVFSRGFYFSFISGIYFVEAFYYSVLRVLGGNLVAIVLFLTSLPSVPPTASLKTFTGRTYSGYHYDLGRG